MTKRDRIAAAAAIVLVCLAAGGTALVIRQHFFRPSTITAYFTSATGIYPGDDVRVSGVKVGDIVSIEPKGPQVKVILKVDRHVLVPADAKAVIMAQNLVSSRYVQLAPAYHSGGPDRSSGPTMADGAVIPVERTAVPVEWDALKEQLMRLATDLGPNSKVSTPSVARFIDSAADALGGNGDKLRQTLAQLSGVGRILADGSGDIVDIIKNLQTFVTALSDSNEQIVQFQDRLATLTSVVDTNRSSLDAALKDLSVALVDVQRFVAGNRDQLSQQVEQLTNVTQNLVDHRRDLRQVLHVAPNAFGNFYNIYNPDTGTPMGSFVFNNLSNSVQLFCGSISAVADVTSAETGKLCGQYLGPALRQINFNYFPLPITPVLMKQASPGNIIYSDPNLAPGGAGGKPGPPELPPAVSAYTGLPGDPVGPPPPPPPARIPGLAQFEPPPTTSAQPSPPSLNNMLLPDGGPQQ